MIPAHAVVAKSIKNAAVNRQNMKTFNRSAPGGLVRKQTNSNLEFFHERYGDIVACIRLNSITLMPK
jgi:hypothetical protein